MANSNDRNRRLICLFKEEIFSFGQPAGAMANTSSAATTQERQRSPASAPRSKARAKKGKGKGKAKPEPPEETDPRKLEMIRWVRVGFITCSSLWTEI